MTSPIEDLLAHLEANPELRNAIMAATTPEEAIKIAENAGYKITAEDLLDAYRNKVTELSQGELEDITGAKSSSCACTGSIGVVIAHSAEKQC